MNAPARASRPPLVQRVRPRDLRLLNDACAVVLIAWYLLPAFKIVARSEVFAAALGLWGITAFCIRRDWLSVKGSHIVPLALWYAVFALNFVFGRATLFGEYLFIMTVFFTPALLFHFYRRTEQADRIVFFSRLILALLCVTALTTLIGQFRYPIPSRTLSKGIESYTALYSSQNIGGFGFTYGLMLYTVALAAFARNLGRGLMQVAHLALIVFFMAVIVKTEFTIAVALVALGVALALALKPRRAAVVALWVVAAALLAVLLFDALSPFMQGITAAIGSNTIRDRVQDVIRFLSTGELGGDFALRADKYAVSVRTALAQPFLGAGAWYGYDTEAKGIGGHVELFDTLARYGLAGAVPLAWFLVANLRDTARLMRGAPMAAGMPAFFALFALYAATNTFFTSSEIGLVLFFAVPALAYWGSPNPGVVQGLCPSHPTSP